MESKALQRVRNRAESATVGKATRSWWSGFTAPALLFGAASTVLTLLGYGAARAHEAMFGFSYSLWYETPIDLMAMSGDTFIGWFHASTNAFGSIPMWRDAGVTGVFVACLALALLTVLWLGTSPEAQLWRECGASWLRACAIWVVTPREKFRDHVTHAAVTAAAAGVIGGLTALSGLVLLTVMLAVVCLLPVLGFIGASAYARAAIIEPLSCISPIGVRLRAKSTTVGAPCVEVTDPATGKSVVGRQILARGSRIFIYSKEEDRAFVVTIKDAAISTVHGPQKYLQVDPKMAARRQ